MRPLKWIIVVCVTLIAFKAIWADAPPADDGKQDRVTLLGTLEEWKYPNTKMPHGATMSDGGYPGILSVKCETILTTPDSFEKVTDFYAKKFAKPAAPAEGEKSNVAKNVDAKSVSTQDDSEGRPVQIQVITVHKATTETTLVISRAKGENETHIVWSHYMRLRAGAPGK